MMNPAARSTYGRLSAPRLEMNFDRVIGRMVFHAVIARNEYVNIKNAVTPSSLRNSTTGARMRWSMRKPKTCVT